MADTTGVLARLQAALSVYDPTWDVSVGTATYKILEAVAQEIATANNNSVLQAYSYNINTKNGNQLDNFCNLFGVYRQLGKRASGLVTFSTGGTPATNILDVPVGTQVAIPIGGNYVSSIYFATTAPAIIGIGDTSVDVPVVASIPGAIGNAPAGAITNLVGSLFGIGSVFNTNPLSGGLDTESDSALRSRWQNTAFNNTTGTFGKYVLTALQNPNVTLATANSTQYFYNEQLQISSTVGVTASGTTATLNFVAYSGMNVNNITYTGTVNVASISISGGSTPSGLQTSLNTTISGLYPGYVLSSGFAYTVSGVSGTTNLNTAGSFNITANLPSPYRITMSGTGGTATTSGITSSGNFYFYESITSNNPDIGTSGTLSYNPTYSGYLFPQGNELVGYGFNTSNQSTFANLVDYYYPSGTALTIPLKINILNNSYYAASGILFNGSQVSLTSEYSPASSRSTTITSGNFVDIFINGTTATQVYEQSSYNPTSVLISGNSRSYLNTQNYTLGSGVTAATNTATTNDIYVSLNQKPLINFPSQISTSSSGVADTVTLYNTTNGLSYIYPIALNPYPYVTFTGTVTSDGLGGTFVTVSNANTFLYPGLALATGTLTSGSQFFISSVTSNGIYLNQNTTATGTVTLSGKAIVYPLYDQTLNQNSILDMSGLAFDTSTPPSGWPALPSSSAWVTYAHDYNGDVTTVESLIQQSRPLGVNTLVHQAQFASLTINARVVLDNSYSQSTVFSNATNLISSYFNGFNYFGTLTFAGLASQFLSVPGIANVKITSVSTTAPDGTVLQTFTSDFILPSNTLPSLYNILYTIRGASNF